MINKLALSLLLFAASSCCIAQNGGPRIVKMGNGLTVIINEDRTAPLAAVEVWVKAGSGYETVANSGVTHFIEHMAFTATKNYAPGELDSEMESLGATLDARTSKDWTRFGVTVMSRYLPEAISVLAEIVTRPSFKEVDIAKERMVILDEIAKKRTEPFKVCKEHLAAALYGDHPYSRPVEGTAESVARMTRDDIVDYYQKNYVPDGMAIVVVGDVDAEKVVGEIGKLFQVLSPKPRPDTSLPDVRSLTSRLTVTRQATYNLDYVAVGFLGPTGEQYTEVCATDLILTSIGTGYRSWMSEELRAKGIIYEGMADFLTERGPGMLSLIFSSPEEKSQQATNAVFDRIETIRKEGISEDRLALAKRSLLGQYAFQNETLAGQAQSFGFYFAVSEPHFANKYIDCVQSITNADIVRAAQKYLDPSRAAIVTIGPNQKDSQ